MKKMKVQANFRQEVVIDPKDVINRLIDGLVGHKGFVKEKNGSFYIVSEQGSGGHSFYGETETTKEDYEYYKALTLVLERLKR